MKVRYEGEANIDSSRFILGLKGDSRSDMTRLDNEDLQDVSTPAPYPHILYASLLYELQVTLSKQMYIQNKNQHIHRVRVLDQRAQLHPKQVPTDRMWMKRRKKKRVSAKRKRKSTLRKLIFRKFCSYSVVRQ